MLIIVSFFLNLTLMNEKSMFRILYKDWVGHYAEGHPSNRLQFAFMAVHSRNAAITCKVYY